MGATRTLSLLCAVMSLATLPARADGYVSFEFPDLGAADRLVMNPYYDTQFGLTFSAVTEFAVADVGLVRNSATLVCIDPEYPRQMLGTSAPGTGNLGDGPFPIRIEFTTPVQPPAIVYPEVVTRFGAHVYVTLYDADGNVVGAYSEASGAANLHEGKCAPEPWQPLNQSGIFNTVSQFAAVSSVLVQASDVFVLDSFSWRDHAVATEPTTWGRVKALYRD
jgi:hypothetical protein